MVSLSFMLTLILSVTSFVLAGDMEGHGAPRAMEKRRVNHSNYKAKVTVSSKAKTSTKAKPAATSSKAAATRQDTLISYANWQYGSTPKELYRLWRQKCIDIVGPKGYHHVIEVNDNGDKTAWVYCHGTPKRKDAPDYTYSTKYPYSKTCVKGPQADFTDQEIRKLGLTLKSKVGTIQQLKGC